MQGIKRVWDLSEEVKALLPDGVLPDSEVVPEHRIQDWGVQFILDLLNLTIQPYYLVVNWTSSVKLIVDTQMIRIETPEGVIYVHCKNKGSLAYEV